MPGAKGEARTGAKLNKIHTKFIFLGVFPDESTVEVVYSFPAGIMGDGAECKMRSPLRQWADRDEGLLRYVAGFFMRWEYKETERGCRSPGAPPTPFTS